MLANGMNHPRQARKTLFVIAKPSQSEQFGCFSFCERRTFLKMLTITTIPQDMRNVLRLYLNNIDFAFEQNKAKAVICVDHVNADPNCSFCIFSRAINREWSIDRELFMRAVSKCDEETRVNTEHGRFSKFSIQKEHSLDERLWCRSKSQRH